MMTPSEEKDIPCFPVTEMTLSAVKEMGMIMLRLDYITNPMQSLNTPNIGVNYALTPKIAADLILMLQQRIDFVGTDEPLYALDQKH